MSGEQKLKDELEKAVWHRDCTARIAKNIAKNVDSLELENAALKAALNECRAWLDNSLNDMEENGESPGSWTVIQTKALFDKCDTLLNKQTQPESDKTE